METGLQSMTLGGSLFTSWLQMILKLALSSHRSSTFFCEEVVDLVDSLPVMISEVGLGYSKNAKMRRIF